MKKHMTGIAMILLAAASAGCEPYGVGPQEIPEHGAPNQWLPATYASEWVGTYVGSGTFNVLETGTVYPDLPVCIEVWLEDRYLEPWGKSLYLIADIHMSVLQAPRDLEDISDGYYSGSLSECDGAEGSLVLQGYARPHKVNSLDTLSMWGPLGDSTWTGEKHQLLQATRRGEDFHWGVWVSRLKTHPQYGKAEVAVLDLFVTKVK